MIANFFVCIAYFTGPEIVMVLEKNMHRKRLSDNQPRNGGIPQHNVVSPRRSRVARVSRSVDREFAMETENDYFSSKPHSEYISRALTRPLLQRRFSLSAITAGRDAGAEDYSHLPSAEYEFYSTRPKSASNVRWSRKDVVYTAENMGFLHEHAPRYTPHTMPTHGGPGYVSTVPKTNVDTKLRTRTSSVTRFVDDYSYIKDHAEDHGRHIKLRASSVPRIGNDAVTSGRRIGSKPILHRRAHSVARTYSTGADRSRVSFSRKSYGATRTAINTEDNDGLDITSFVLAPGEQFIPTNVSVSILPSGKKAVTYTRFSQKGTGDQHKANAEIDRIIQRTNRLQVIFHFNI